MVSEAEEIRKLHLFAEADASRDRDRQKSTFPLQNRNSPLQQDAKDQNFYHRESTGNFCGYSR